MLFTHSTRILAIAVASVLGAACSQPAEPPPPAGTPPPQAVAQNTKTHMDDHFTRVKDIEEAVIRGDLDGAKAPARWLADHQEAAGLPPAAASHVAPMKDAAKAIAEASDIPTAAKSAAWLVGACGDCHTASNVKAPMPEPAMPAEGKDTKSHMAEHQYAVDLMYRGLAEPSDEDWAKGAQALAAAPLGGTALPEGRESALAEQKVHEIATSAVKITDRSARITAYSEVIASCAGCHSMHGRVLGPGAPKAE